jgi:hypothetical protein
MLHTRWSAEAWAQARVEFKKALALRSQIRRGSNEYLGRSVWIACSCGAVLVHIVAFG